VPEAHKARLCLRGRELLYAWCRQRGIGHRRCAPKSWRWPALHCLAALAIAGRVGELVVAD